MSSRKFQFSVTKRKDDGPFVYIPNDSHENQNLFAKRINLKIADSIQISFRYTLIHYIRSEFRTKIKTSH